MGRRRQSDSVLAAATPAVPRRSGASRREFFLRSGAAGAALAAAPLLPLAAQAGTSVFQHGVASGDPLADRVILWTRVTPPDARSRVSVRLDVATDPGMANVVQQLTLQTGSALDYTVKVDVDWLLPAATYYYRFFALGQASPVGRTRTLPAGRATRLRMAVASCSSLAHGYFNAYRRIAERADLDLVLHLGDYIYEYATNEYGTVRPYEPATEILTLRDYRTRHAQYKRDADLQELHRQHPVIAIWDDHEVANDAWKRGAENHSPETEGQWRRREAQALQAYYEWMPVRVVDPADPRRNNRSFRYGDLVELVMLEERLGARSQQLVGDVVTPFGVGFTQTGAFADPNRSMLGGTQERWLSDTLRQAPTTWKFIGQGVMMAQLKAVPAPNAAGGGVFLNPDQWDGYQPSRDRLYNVLKGADGGAPVNNVVVLTGDIHSSWAADLAQDPNNPVVAAGGYDPATGAGASAVEFVGTSITSAGGEDPTGEFAALLRSLNPHFKYIELTKRGYMLIDADASRVVAEWWYVDTVATPSTGHAFGTAFQVTAGTARLQPATATLPRPDAPPLAP